jgi:hypothetical protein
MAAFQFYLQSGKQRKVEWVGDDSHVFGQQFPAENGSVRRCTVVTQQPVLLSPKFGAKPSHIFMQSPQNVTVVCGIDCLAFRDEIFVYNPLEVQENDEHALKFAFHLHHLFRYALNQTCH